MKAIVSGLIVGCLLMGLFGCAAQEPAGDYKEPEAGTYKSADEVTRTDGTSRARGGEAGAEGGGKEGG